MDGIFKCVLLFTFISFVTPYEISLLNNGPVVIGATITFNAELLNDDRTLPSGTFRFLWQDNAIPQNSYETKGEATTSLWNLTYSPNVYSPGLYEVQVSVSRFVSWAFYWNIGSARQYFNITGRLNGELQLKQNTSISNKDSYISSAKEVNHEVMLHPADAEFVMKKATSVMSYWFINSVYYGEKTNLSFKFNYTNAVDQDQVIEALVVVSFDPPEPNTTLAPPLTTILPTSTSSTTTTTTSLSTTALKTREERSVLPTVAPTVLTTARVTTNHVMPTVEQLIMEGKNISEILYPPYVCLNKTCGYFQRKIKVRAPVSNVIISGTNWLQHGDMLNLSVSCNGSAPYAYCIKIVLGEYNATGNETCLSERFISDCQLSVLHYFRLSNTYTVLIIFRNDVSRKVSPVVVNVYQVTKHPQLSVIIVPVTCISIAFVLIVFGVAYYIQSQRRYVIEVADFDFVQASGMEYKTFMERLRDSVSATINRTQDYVEEGNVWSPSRKYGSMQ